MYISNNFEKLNENFKDIKNKGWIRVPKYGFGENGLFFEELLGIRHNDLSIPDYKDIEVKVQSKYSKFPITLFSLTFDGPEPMELQAFVSRFGVIDSIYKDCKVLYMNLNSTRYTNWGKSLKMKLHCDYKRKRLYVHVLHSNNKTIELRSYWDFDSLISSIERKVTNLCIVNNQTRIFNNKKYIKYTDINFYTLTSCERFIGAINAGKVFVKIKYGIYKKGPRSGKPYNHGIAFQIYQSDLDYLFDDVFAQKK